MVGKLTPQERIRIAKGLRAHANRPNMPAPMRLKLRRAAATLIALNRIEAERAPQPPKPKDPPSLAHGPVGPHMLPK
ncbi:MAG: hypothetical protein IT536_02575 [Hyphomicrobiales bacterium]|nr:hypothetical protein [Hyphomicrobiales bacterium]